MSKRKEEQHIENEGVEMNNISPDTENKSVDENVEQNSTQEEETETQSTEEELNDLKDKYLRTVAEFENFKKRTLKEKTELILNGGEKVITTLLPVLDDMERAIANADKLENKDAVEEGWELIYKKLVSTLETLGVKKMEVNNQDFNVDYHEAIAMVAGTDDDQKGKVIDCVQTGYTLNDKVIRHAKVAVGQ
jgi:grpE